jgi:hypothetical protein
VHDVQEVDDGGQQRRPFVLTRKAVDERIEREGRRDEPEQVAPLIAARIESRDPLVERQREVQDGR